MKRCDLTAIIPAAGKSKRFKKGNKIFFKVPSLNLSLIEIVISKVIKFASRIVIILNKSNYRKCKILVNRKYKNKEFTFLIQDKIKNGTAIAVYEGLKFTKTNLACVVWGDHIGISKPTIMLAIKKILKKKPKLAACVPARRVKKNYTNVVVKKNYLIKEIRSFYDEKKIKNNALNDCGFFIFKTKLMKNALKKNIGNDNLRLKKNNEYDFLKIFFFLKKKVLMTQSTSKFDTLGINKYNDIKKFLNVFKHNSAIL